MALASNFIFFSQPLGEESASVVGTIDIYRVEGPSYSSMNGSEVNDSSLLPSWISAKSKEELRALQLEDLNIEVILKSKEMNQKPHKA